ncbi:hypothetical protein DE146DRAFT_50232 [Phaeosphaeria sp. MPI-PUGE-AT-0046c]|nr:hypothetical protein DE146DRAFT_50232 [Phaeosphaeria sp. MPI-PUGE-AT-0046c]
MGTLAANPFLLPHQANLCPPPLQYTECSRRKAVRRRILRKPTQSQHAGAQGPLDDIIAEIKTNILEAPPDCTSDSLLLNWGNPLKAPSTWAVTPLPVSRAPSDRPLAIRKHRDNRSSTSGSSMGDLISYSRDNGHGQGATATSADKHPYVATSIGLTFDTTASSGLADSANASNSLAHTGRTTGQCTLESTLDRVDSNARNEARCRPSRLRRFTNGFPRLRRIGTGDTSTSTSDAPEKSSSSAEANPLDDSNKCSSCQDALGRNDEAAGACTENLSLSKMQRIANRLPTPVEVEHELPEGQQEEGGAIPTTLRAAVRMFPQAKILAEAHQEISVAIEIEGVLYGRRDHSNPTIDLIFIIDNGYYVSRECIERATDAVNGALYLLRRGDRIALYTTHCVHTPVTGNRPELHHPLWPISTESEEVFQDLTAKICRYGRQTWDPARPNPAMADVVLSVASSLQKLEPKKSRTHIILLSPAAYVLHELSKTFPDLYVHRISPAALPYRREPELQDMVCFESCCKNVFVSNWTSYQSIPSRIKRILKNARSKDPVGELSAVSIDIRPRKGCELIVLDGCRDIAHLRLGQVHHIFARVRVTTRETQTVDLDSCNPIFNSSLDVKGLRQELQCAAALGAAKVHILDVQLYHRNTIHDVDCWNYTETPLFVIRELGGLATPISGITETYKRLYFHKLVAMTTEDGLKAAEIMLAALEVDKHVERTIVERIYQELKGQSQTRRYEQDYRQKLPLCPGPIDLEAPHEWFHDVWNRRKGKRHGMAGVKGVDVSNLSDGVERLTT